MWDLMFLTLILNGVPLMDDYSQDPWPIMVAILGGVIQFLIYLNLITDILTNTVFCHRMISHQDISRLVLQTISIRHRICMFSEQKRCRIYIVYNIN